MRLVICADDDRWTQGNPGITEAAEVASAVNADIAILRFEDLSERPTDFNDMHQHSGLDVVRTCIDNAKAPAKDMNQSSSGNALNRAAANSIEAEAIGACAADKRISYRRASDIQAEPIPWLWPDRIARGKVSMLAGNPGLGKSQITASMAAIASTGGLWPADRTNVNRATW
jgi:hypothetical protein